MLWQISCAAYPGGKRIERSIIAGFRSTLPSLRLLLNLIPKTVTELILGFGVIPEGVIGNPGFYYDPVFPLKPAGMTA